MKESTMQAALKLLDTQYGHTKYEKKHGKIVPVHTYENERQDAYYDGMRVMLEFILTEGYELPGAVVRGIEHRFETRTEG